MARGARTVRTDRARDKFLTILAVSCNVSEAARAAGIGRTSAYEWRDDDPVFAAAWKEAEEEAADKLEREAWRRALEGTDKPITYQGEITGTYKEYSDRMLEILLKAHRGNKYRDKQAVELTGRDGGAIEIDQVHNDADAFTRTIIGIAARRRAGTGAEETQH